VAGGFISPVWRISENALSCDLYRQSYEYTGNHDIALPDRPDYGCHLCGEGKSGEEPGIRAGDETREPIVVSRHNSRKDFVLVMTRGKEILSGGRSLVIFPQSTRLIDFRPKEFNSLGVKLASKPEFR